MTMQDLITKLKERPTSVDDYRKGQLADWQEAVRGLLDNIESWVGSAVQAGVLAISRADFQFREEGFGFVDTHRLSISDGPVTVRIEPVSVRVTGMVQSGGRRLLGLSGQVDIICGPERIPLVRKEGAPPVWLAVPMRGEPWPLTEESFSQILSEILLDESLG